MGARAAVPAFANAHPPSKAAFAAQLLRDSYVLCQAPVFLYFKHSSKLFLQVQRTGLRKTSLESTVFQILEWQASSLHCENDFMGLTSFKGADVTLEDVRIAKNYLSEKELKKLNALVSGFFDMAEYQAENSFFR